jgi:putative oxidoreductase
MKALTTLGRILYALPFAVFGINHFIMKDFFMGELTSFIPFGGYMILLTGVLLIATSISIITKKYIRLSTLVLAGMLLLFIATIHIPQLFDPDKKMIAMIALLKDISLMGGSLMIAGMTEAQSSVKRSPLSRG